MDALNKVMIFQTNCDLNIKYDTNGFSEVVGQIQYEPHIDNVKNSCAELGASDKVWGTMLKLYFNPIDEMKDIELEDYSQDQVDQMTQKINFFINEKALAYGESDAEPISKQTLSELQLFLENPNATAMLADRLMIIDANLRTEQKF